MYTGALITGPYFKAYFHRPEPAEIALMVSVLQAGALGQSLHPLRRFIPVEPKLTLLPDQKLLHSLRAELETSTVDESPS